MTRPSPLAPPVTTPTLPSKEKEARVRFMCIPPRPVTGTEEGSSPSSGYSTVMESSVRAKAPGVADGVFLFLLAGLAMGGRVCRSAIAVAVAVTVMLVLVLVAGHSAWRGAAIPVERRARVDVRRSCRESISSLGREVNELTIWCCGREEV